MTEIVLIFGTLFVSLLVSFAVAALTVVTSRRVN